MCGNGSWFVQVIRSPAFTRITAGTKAVPSIGYFVHRRIAGTALRRGGADGQHRRTGQNAHRDLHHFFPPSVAWTIFACSRCATNAGRTFTSSAFSSSFFALGISVLSTASSTC